MWLSPVTEVMSHSLKLVCDGAGGWGGGVVAFRALEDDGG